MMKRRSEWSQTLEADETRELLRAAREACAGALEGEQEQGESCADGGHPARAARRLAALPLIRNRSRRWRRELMERSGVTLIRGVPAGDMSPSERAAVFLAIGRNIGHAVSQNASGHLLGHVYDLGGEMKAERRLYTTNLAQPFHTDSSDVVGLMCIRQARAGGESSVVSSSQIFNEVLRIDERLARVLTEPFLNDRKGEADAGQLPYFAMPVFMFHEGKLLSMYDRTFIDAAQERFADQLPRLTDEQVAALDLCDELCTRDDLRIDMDLMPGDIQLLHNHNTWHARSAYSDHSDGRKRHLLRYVLQPQLFHFLERLDMLVNE